MPTAASLSFVLATYNRRDVVLATLQRLRDLGDDCAGAEIIVVDNASCDDTAAAVRATFREVQVIQAGRNLGACAKALGVDRAGGEYVVFLDDDSYPRPGSIPRMMDRFRADAGLGAAGFLVYLPDGRAECSALPNVFTGCGVGFRRDALREVGGLDRTLFMAAEEYDLAFRLVTAGWKCVTFSDLAVDHLKTPHARASARLVYYDTRNNLILIARYLPDEYECTFRQDWSQRYGWIAQAAGHRAAFWRGWLAGRCRRGRERSTYAPWRLTDSAFEYLFRFERICDRMAAVAHGGARTVLFADLGKNIYPFVRAAQRVGLRIACIADDRMGGAARRYRGLPIRSLADGLACKPDAIVVSNTSPVHAAITAERLAAVTTIPIHRWFGYDIAMD